MSPAKHPHTITTPPSSSRWEPHMRRSSGHLLRISQRHCGWNQKSQIWTHQHQRPDFHWSNVHCLGFLAQANLLLLVCFSSGFFAALRPRRSYSRSLLLTVDVEICLLLELCDAFIWSAIWGAINSNELILCSRGNSGFSFPVAVLMRASFIMALDGFCDCTWHFHVLK